MVLNIKTKYIIDYITNHYSKMSYPTFSINRKYPGWGIMLITRGETPGHCINFSGFGGIFARRSKNHDKT